MIKVIIDTIKAYNLFEYGDKVLVAVSGGADSVCLLHVLHTLSNQLGITVSACHMHHGLRGKTADRDEKFTEDFCCQLNIPCITKHADVKKYAKENSISEETAGRELRYAFFEQLCKEEGFTKIATAHHKDDNAETVLMHFLRGSGLNGMCGIPVRREKIVRPLLAVSRKEIEAYCRENQLCYVTDETNCETVYTRNKLRLEVIPYLSKFNAELTDTIWKNSRLFCEDRDFLEEQSSQTFYRLYCPEDGFISLKEAKALPPSLLRRVLIRMIRQCEADFSVSYDYIQKIMEMIYTKGTGTGIDLPKGIRAWIAYDRLYLKHIQQPTADYEYKIQIGEAVLIPEAGVKVTVKRVQHPGDNTFTVDETQRLIIRNRRAGDTFYPNGMSGRKKVKDFFIDCKIPRDCRQKQPILINGEEIVYIIGKRKDRRFSFCKTGIQVITEKI